MLELYTDDAVFDVSRVFTDVAPLQGSTNIRSYWGTLRETWDGLRFDPLKAYDVGGNRLVVEQRMWATGTQSKIQVDQRLAMLYAIRPEDGKVARAVLFPDVEAAIAAADAADARSVR
jgi:ketosteroid isomerase-like protein